MTHHKRSNALDPTRVDHKEPCFPIGTPVQVPTPEGATTSIERVLVGDQVKAFDLESRVVVEATVVSIGEYAHPTAVFDVELGGKEVIGVVPGHLFEVDGRWVPIEELDREFTCQTSAGKPIEAKILSSDRVVDKVYNIRVRQFNDYIIGETGLVVRDY